jgi:hypothetical protein
VGCHHAESRGVTPARTPTVPREEERIEEADKRLFILDVDGAEALLPKHSTADRVQLTRQRIAMARLEFDAAWKLDNPRSSESRQLAWRIAWYRDDIRRWSQLFPERPRVKETALEAALAQLGEIVAPAKRNVADIDSARSVTVVVKGNLGAVPYGFSCKLGDTEARTGVFLAAPVTLASPKLVRKADWVDLSFVGSNGGVLKVHTLVIPDPRIKAVDLMLGSDLARFLNFSFDSASSTATFSLDAPSRPTKALVVPLYWPRGEYPAMVVSAVGPSDVFADTVAIFGGFGEVKFSPSWVKVHAPWSVSRANVGPFVAEVTDFRDGEQDISANEDVDAHAMVGWRTFLNHRTTLGAGGREFWVE